MELMEPFSTSLNLQSGQLEPVGHIISRNLSDMRHMYLDKTAEQQILDQEGDRLIYEVQVVDLPEEEGQVLQCTTILYPGRIGSEYHMTKGHFHAKRDRGEVYLGLSGTGYVLFQSDSGLVRHVPIHSGAVVYVPPMWAHRTINFGRDPLIFLSAWPGDAGHDYGTIEQRGFAQLLVDQDGQPSFINNPRYQDQ